MHLAMPACLPRYSLLATYDLRPTTYDLLTYGYYYCYLLLLLLLLQAQVRYTYYATRCYDYGYDDDYDEGRLLRLLLILRLCGNTSILNGGQEMPTKKHRKKKNGAKTAKQKKKKF